MHGTEMGTGRQGGPSGRGIPPHQSQSHWLGQSPEAWFKGGSQDSRCSHAPSRLALHIVFSVVAKGLLPYAEVCQDSLGPVP